MRVCGIDGCPGGWLAVHRREGRTTARIYRRFCEVLDEEPGTIAVDMPIGLPDMVTHATSAREREARAGLGERQSSLFTVPCRAALAEEAFAAACAVNRAGSANGKAISKQMFHLFPKIREIDALMSAALGERVFETHPEVAFWVMNGERPLATPKKVKGVPHPAGLAERARLLVEVAGFEAAFLSTRLGPRTVHGPDDLLDACACAFAAERIACGEARMFPAEPLVDAKGIRMAIFA